MSAPMFLRTASGFFPACFLLDFANDRGEYRARVVLKGK